MQSSSAPPSPSSGTRIWLARLALSLSACPALCKASSHSEHMQKAHSLQLTIARASRPTIAHKSHVMTAWPLAPQSSSSSSMSAFAARSKISSRSELPSEHAEPSLEDRVEDLEEKEELELVAEEDRAAARAAALEALRIPAVSPRESARPRAPAIGSWSHWLVFLPARWPHFSAGQGRRWSIAEAES